MSGMSTDGYEILDRIGQGSFGIVSKVRRKIDRAVLCWKEINFGKMSEKEKSQLVSEVNIIRELRNPFIVRYHDRILHKATTRLFIVMEYCPSGDLAGLIKKARRDRTYVDEGFVWKILAQCTLALKECHRRTENGVKKPILHRDLKPANILLDGDKNVKIADFGLAKELSSKSQLAQTNLGTPYYMAPEIINEKDYDERADIWSLGCLVYELAALRPPFDASNAVTLAVKINKGDYPRLPGKFSNELMNAISKMIQLDPRRRPRVEDLEGFPGIEGAIRTAKALLNNYASQVAMKNKERELIKREEKVAAREKELDLRESELHEREEALQQKEIFSRQQQQRRQSFGTLNGGKMDVDAEDTSSSSDLPDHLREAAHDLPTATSTTSNTKTTHTTITATSATSARPRVPIVKTRLNSAEALPAKPIAEVPTVSIYIDDTHAQSQTATVTSKTGAGAGKGSEERGENYRDDLSFGIRRARALLQGRGSLATEGTTHAHVTIPPEQGVPTSVFGGMIPTTAVRKREVTTNDQHRYKSIPSGKENIPVAQKPALRNDPLQQAENTANFKENATSPWKRRRQHPVYNPQPRLQTRGVNGGHL